MKFTSTLVTLTAFLSIAHSSAIDENEKRADTEVGGDYTYNWADATTPANAPLATTTPVETDVVVSAAIDTAAGTAVATAAVDVTGSEVGGDYTYPGTVSATLAVGTATTSSSSSTGGLLDTLLSGGEDLVESLFGDDSSNSTSSSSSSSSGGGFLSTILSLGSSLVSSLFSSDSGSGGSFLDTLLSTGESLVSSLLGGSSNSTSSSGGLISTAEGLLSGLLGDIDFESIAGYLDDLLTSNNNVQYLDDILIWLKDSNLLPEATMLLLNANLSSPTIDAITSEVVDYGLDLLSTSNTTGFFVALKDSGLLYSILAGALEDTSTIPAVGAIVKDVIANGDITISEVLAAAGRLLKREDGEEDVVLTLRDLESVALEANRIEQTQLVAKREFEISQLSAMELKKRDNIEDLLTTIFSSVERSGLIPELIHTLLVNPEFQTDVADIIISATKSFSAGTGTPSGLSFIGPVISGLVESGILGDTFERAINDQTLRASIISQIGSLLGSGAASITDFFSSKDVETYYKGLIQKAAADNSTVSSTLSVSTTSGSSGSSSASATVTGSSSSQANGNVAANANVLALLAGLSGYAMIV
ncbi:hypothetical protein CLIB1423_14S03290 [[Candida] railenensis]|uniref:Uncharacterized protein n=1 Tax=[Candida] railenensis TaxID=45579 RepID=A0A9P0QT82_9ASCO|nr:hypothetical protein CLIB1423_14S03290 [[Candida] railenensis]